MQPNEGVKSILKSKLDGGASVKKLYKRDGNLNGKLSHRADPPLRLAGKWADESLSS
jgi:hypothetical protein